MKKGLLLLLGCVALCRGEETLLSGPDIYAGMLATYAEARSYEDEGEVRTVFFESRGQRTDIKPFTTAFVRPGAFRFEFKNRYNPGDEWDRYLIWQSGETVKTWWSIQPGIRVNQTLEDAISAATGVSGSSSANVTALLLPGMEWGRRLRTLTGVKLADKTLLNGVPAYELQGRMRDGTLLTLWIDARSFLLLQLFEKRQFAGFRTETTTVYTPRVNGPVSPEKLQFNPGHYHSIPERVADESLLPFGFIVVLLLVNLLHWRLRPGSQWRYELGLRDTLIILGLLGLFAGLGVRSQGTGMMWIMDGFFFIFFAYTLWRRERAHAGRALETEPAHP